MEESELRHLSEIADAELGVAENLGWWGAIFLAGGVAQRWNWWIGIPLGLLWYYIITRRYRTKQAKAEDDYYRAAKLGKYVGRP